MPTVTDTHISKPENRQAKPARVLAIGDIHGCLRALDTLFEMVVPTADDLVIALGDYVDRGPDSRGVIDRLIEFSASRPLVALLGNHEQMMLEADEDPATMESWRVYGGAETLMSYGADAATEGLQCVPEGHWRFLRETCVDWYENDTHFFVHAGVDAELPLARQSIYRLRWEKFDCPRPHPSGKVMVCGHTRQLSGVPLNLGHAVCIDTNVYGDGWLTCLDTQSGQLWQASQRGPSRTAHLDEFLVE